MFEENFFSFISEYGQMKYTIKKSWKHWKIWCITHAHPPRNDQNIIDWNIAKKQTSFTFDSKCIPWNLIFWPILSFLFKLILGQFRRYIWKAYIHYSDKTCIPGRKHTFLCLTWSKIYDMSLKTRFGFWNKRNFFIFQIIHWPNIPFNCLWKINVIWYVTCSNHSIIDQNITKLKSEMPPNRILCPQKPNISLIST